MNQAITQGVSQIVQTLLQHNDESTRSTALQFILSDVHAEIGRGSIAGL
jgi:hypothetical protein